jgi:chemotaxis protein MotB
MIQNAWHDETATEAAGRDRWLLSYADLLTLLLAFFVVMYSVSAVNETKLAELSKSLAASFNQPQRPTEIAEPDAIGAIQAEIEPQSIVDSLNLDVAFSGDGHSALSISLPGELLFDSGASDLKPGAAAELDRLLPILKSVSTDIQVIGHTDNVAVSSSRFPSNWELSAHRAAAAVRYLEQVGIPRRQLLAIGRADVLPVANNNSEAGRASNRRVVFKASDVDWTKVKLERPGEPEVLPEQTPEAEQTLPDIEAIDPALLEQLLRDLESGGG